MFFPQGEMMGDDKQPVIPTHWGLTAILGMCGNKPEESWEDGARFPKDVRGLTWEEVRVKAVRDSFIGEVAFDVSFKDGESRQPSFSHWKPGRSIFL